MIGFWRIEIFGKKHKESSSPVPPGDMQVKGAYVGLPSTIYYVHPDQVALARRKRSP